MLFAAAVICFVIGLVHSILGERFILIRLFKRDSLPKIMGSDLFTRNTIRFAWHLTTIAWFGFGYLLMMLFFQPQAILASVNQVVIVVFATSGVIALVSSKGKHLSWVAFLSIAGLTYFQ